MLRPCWPIQSATSRILSSISRRRLDLSSIWERQYPSSTVTNIDPARMIENVLVGSCLMRVNNFSFAHSPKAEAFLEVSRLESKISLIQLYSFGLPMLPWCPMTVRDHGHPPIVQHLSYFSALDRAPDVSSARVCGDGGQFSGNACLVADFH